jgi:hypothetical protein
LKSEEVKFKFLKAKKIRMAHQNMLRINVKIQNMKSKEQMQNENNIHQILPMLPPGNQFILNPNGRPVDCLTKYSKRSRKSIFPAHGLAGKVIGFILCVILNATHEVIKFCLSYQMP